MSAPPPTTDAPLVVLIVDDDPVSQRVARRLLSLRGHSAHLASDGREAVELATLRRFDVILMDLEMPQMDGFDATTEIRRLEAGHRARIIGTTASLFEGARRRCLAADMDVFLAKPLRAESLWAAVEHRVAAAPDVAPKTDMADIRAAALAQLGGDRDLLEIAAAAFLGDCDAMLRTLRQGMSRRDADLVRSAAHRLKGALANFGAKPAVDAAACVEHAAAQKSWTRIETTLPVAEAETRRLAGALATLLRDRA